MTYPETKLRGPQLIHLRQTAGKEEWTVSVVRNGYNFDQGIPVDSDTFASYDPAKARFDELVVTAEHDPEYLRLVKRTKRMRRRKG